MSQVIESKFKKGEVLLFIFALLFILLVQGALPFFSMPTFAQAAWVIGFSQSFLNEGIFNIYARNFGAPEPAAIAFGLAGAWPVAVFIKLGLHPADAYSLMVALWLSIAFISAYKIGRYFSVHPKLSILGAISWMTMPVIWAHAHYSMLSTGISLFSFYFLAALYLFDPKYQIGKLTKWNIVNKTFFYLVLCLISIFMDGYSFMMFAVGVSLLGVWQFISEKGSRRRLIWFSFPIHFFSLVIAYLLYTFYIGKTQFEQVPIDFFRGWGVDLTFLLIPTEGIHWLPDLIGWSIPRSEDVFFGDASVWTTSFSIPVIIGSIWAAFYIFGKKKITIGLILVAAFGFYMALGPSLKVNSVKPIGEEVGVMMAEKYSIAPTGSALLSEYLPGFKNMRASYRWGALGVFSAWMLIVLAMSSDNKRTISAGAALVISVITFLNLPNLPQKLKSDIKHREQFLSLDAELIEEMRKIVSPHEKVAFLPWRNDFLVNYVASQLNIVTFNIGGDKNLLEARSHWPEIMHQFPKESVDYGFADRVLLLLAKNEADVVILLPYIEMLWESHQSPYLVQFKDALGPSLARLNSSEGVHIENRDFYVVVRLKPEIAHLAQQGVFESIINKKLCLLPECLKRMSFVSTTPSHVGTVQKGKLVSTGRAGFLHFGPRVSMEAGNYKLLVRGKGNMTSSTWVDVVSGKGTIEYGKFTLHPTIHDGGLLAEGQVQLDAPVEDIEIRVYVGAEDDVTLEGYELVPVETEDHSASLEHNPLN
ncbi:hypothetical protein [Methylobacter sp. BlB1]|uniref:hypothetical protein n=1 Tax=Methylobacter sp. BlB1 TaxID=2785914 RepID=UPI00189537E5|nr:hypothetical protein [Methylobacter sp. BlB1]MBF6648509.1 hypothetical protein [Methylobacter sp. BlB1]